MEKSCAKTTPTAESTSRTAEIPQALGSQSHSLLRLQATIGNQAVRRLLHNQITRTNLTASHPSNTFNQEPERIAEQVSLPEPQLQRSCDCGGSCTTCQSKTSGLKVSQPTDAAETEADRLSEKAMRMPISAETHVTKSGNVSDMLYRKLSGGEGHGERVQRKELSSGQDIPSQSPSHVKNAMNTGGQPLDAHTRSFFEPRLGYDLSNVRVHTDSRAGESARAVAAKAYTLGNNIVFGRGQYSPNSEAGKKLIAHELAHVTQAGSSSNIRRDTIYRQPDDTDDDWSFFDGMSEDDIERISQGFRSFPTQTEQPTAAPKAVETGCHTDPYAGHKTSTVCGQKRPDEATQASMKLMESNIDFDEFAKQRKARREWLHALHEQARVTKTFPANEEHFSKYEIAADQELDVSERWEISAAVQRVGENDLEVDHYNTLLFRGHWEYNIERRRREKEFEEKFSCKSGHGLKWPSTSRLRPEWIDCQNRVEAEYRPREHARKEAARWRAFIDIQTAMPVLTEAGPIAAFGFHVAHEWLGWSTERSAAFGGALSTTAGLVGLRTQQVYSNRLAGQNVVPADEITPPPEYVGAPPTRGANPAPGKPTVGQMNQPTIANIPKVNTPPPVTTITPRVTTGTTTTVTSTARDKTPPTVKTPPPTVKTPPPTVKTPPPEKTPPPTVKTPPPEKTPPPTVKTPSPEKTPPPDKAPPTVKAKVPDKTPPTVKPSSGVAPGSTDLAAAQRQHEQLKLESGQRIDALRKEQASNQPTIDALNSQIKANESRVNGIRKEANLARINGSTTSRGQKLIDELTTAQDKKQISEAKRRGATDAKIQEWVLVEKAREIEAATAKLRSQLQAPVARNTAISIEINKLEGIIAIPDRAGGSYKAVFEHVNEGYSEANHLPPKDAYLGKIKLTKNEGPAIWMTEEDHKKTASWGSSDDAKKWRADQRELIRQGKFMEAMQKDIDDIRAKFPDGRYEKGIKMALEYAKQLGSKIQP